MRHQEESMKILLAIALAGALTLAACGGDDDTGSTSGSGATPDTGGVRPSTAGAQPTAANCQPVVAEGDGNGPGIPPLTGDVQELTATSPYDNCPVTMRYIDEVVGTGAALGVTDAAQCDTNPASVPTVTVHYTGWLNDGTKFDSSVDRGTPASFNLCGVIPGWTVGVGSMNVGGKRRLVIPAGLAYGPDGRPPSIPGGATLIFDVEVLNSP
jgi:hypothetical protein